MKIGIGREDKVFDCIERTYEDDGRAPCHYVPVQIIFLRFRATNCLFRRVRPSVVYTNQGTAQCIEKVCQNRSLSDVQDAQKRENQGCMVANYGSIRVYLYKGFTRIPCSAKQHGPPQSISEVVHIWPGTSSQDFAASEIILKASSA